MLLIIFVILFVIITYIVKNKLVIRFDTFFRKGFSKHDDNYGIYCFCRETTVTGKTYSIVDALETLGKGKIIITNVYSYAQNHKNTIYETDFGLIYELLKNIENCENYIIFYDEIFTLIEKGKLSRDMLSFLSQMRKRHLYLYTTCQEWLELNITFRRYVRFQVQCRMINIKIFNFAISINEINDAYSMKWDNLENEYVCPRIKTTVKKCRQSDCG